MQWFPGAASSAAQNPRAGALQRLQRGENLYRRSPDRL
jgi:hypothetical protein